MDNVTKDSHRILDLEKGRNFRELGGYKTIDGQTIKYHKVLRSAGLGDLTDKDVNFLDNYGLKTDIDFRSKEEVEKKPDRIPKGTKYLSLPVFKEDETEASKIQGTSIPDMDYVPIDGYNHMLDAYLDMINGEQAKKAYQNFFGELLTNDNDNEVLLFHCSAGKDRTGMGAFFLMSALGVPMKTIKDDYLLTNEASKSYTDKLFSDVLKHDPSLVDTIKALMTVNINYLKTAEDAIKQTSGSIDNYIKNELKVSDSDIKDLKKIYLS
ncbi:tyrosine-protein phosphatase [Companilactobacillus insicii]|uniref:tyrosine-protein phosphatase n=1 Tax=Companilactobacillus insicii TaxID=1732567 RepID=UPI000F775F4B|nr:tyrosine-protein phosphatase [Companilactobacillus insicii]